jgi:NAD+ diphosphatase
LSYLLRDLDPGFVPAASPEPAEDALLFAFRKGSLVHRDGPFSLPTVAEARNAGLPLEALAPLGKVGDRAAALAALPDDAALTAPLLASNLRRLFFSLEGPLLHAAALAAQLAHFESTSRYCGACARPLSRKIGERAKRCDTCDRELYPPVSPCTIVLVHRGDEILLARASRLPPGMFALVAGFVEPGETLEACVQREVAEEVGLEVTDIRYVASQPWPFPSQLMVGFFARAVGGELRADPSEIEEARWFGIRELPMIPPPFSVARFLIDTYLEERGVAPAR